jgi:hypothetical protein
MASPTRPSSTSFWISAESKDKAMSEGHRPSSLPYAWDTANLRAGASKESGELAQSTLLHGDAHSRAWFLPRIGEPSRIKG